MTWYVSYDFPLEYEYGAEDEVYLFDAEHLARAVYDHKFCDLKRRARWERVDLTVDEEDDIVWWGTSIVMRMGKAKWS